ncbi:Glucanosyltransferase-domain-containing protein [Mycena rosella]|uniref:1,3-beta-glucanosyltransferase n=1 Tax=Mycena rosella TaxID=1033263 RepID=A0AAD7CRL1_MYCRO|nr:Glucanosyltransferase-domain-containing protein [Mycena rosella]
MLNVLGLAATALLVSVATVGALPKVSRTGKYLFTENGARFFIKGIAYQTQGIVISGPNNPLNQPSTFVDNLADSAACARDVPFLQKLGVNAIRAYSVNSSLDHDSCMGALSSAGIYVILDLTLPLNGSVDTTQPAWSTNTLDQYLRTVDAFEKYDNILAYNIGNEVMGPKATQAAPFITAAARDIRAYLNSISSSALVGYAAIDGPSAFVDDTANYLACDRSATSATASIDLFGLNNYEWCGDAANTTFDAMNARFANYEVAAYFSEFGSENCNPNPRVWTEIPVMFSAPMTNVWSGGLAFSYFSALSKGHEFGMAVVSADNTSITTNGDFDNLAAKFNAVSFANSPPQASATSVSPTACPASDAAAWPVATVLPPTPDDAACGCLANALSCVFQPPSPDYMELVGSLIGVACGLVLQAGGSCVDIMSNGTTGTYGVLAMCDPTIKLSYLFSSYYELNHRASLACDFSGNATLNSAAPPALGASAAATSCIPSPSAIFTPPAPPVLLPVAPHNASASNTSGSGSGSGSSQPGNGAAPRWASMGMGLGAVVGCVLGGALWTLA